MVASMRVARQLDFPTTLCRDSPIPMGLTPGHLLRAIRRLARSPRTSSQG